MKIIFSLFLLAATSEGSDNYKVRVLDDSHASVQQWSRGDSSNHLLVSAREPTCDSSANNQVSPPSSVSCLTSSHQTPRLLNKKSSLLRKQEERDAVRGARRLKTLSFATYGTGTCTEPLGCPDGSVAICYLHNGSDSTGPHYHSKCLPTKDLNGVLIGQSFSSDKYLAACGPCSCLQAALGSSTIPNIKPPGKKSAKQIASLQCPPLPPPQICFDEGTNFYQDTNFCQDECLVVDSTTDGLVGVPDICEEFVTPVASDCSPTSESCTGDVDKVQEWCGLFKEPTEKCCTAPDGAKFAACSWKGLATISKGSCKGDGACWLAGGSDSNAITTVGANSCNGDYACREIGWSSKSGTQTAKSVSIGANSCNGFRACTNIAAILGDIISIADRSCIGDGACDYVGYSAATLVTIDDRSCIGNYACYVVGYDLATSVTIEYSTCTDKHCKVINTNICGGDNFDGEGIYYDLTGVVTCDVCKCSGTKTFIPK